MPRILYIEDNADNRLLVRRILMAENLEVEEADNAVDGIQQAQANPPDLILMDISMPGIDGLNATQRLRNMPELNSVPIIALTANVRDGDKEMTLKAGCDGYIGKPIDVDNFPKQVMDYLRMGRQ
jgi:CheY-like chemotaxis protein